MILKGNCLDTLKTLPDCSVDSIVTDPPYELGFMGKSWDNSGIAYNQDLWAECLRVLKPGGHLLAFSGSRTYHRMVVAIEDSGEGTCCMADLEPYPCPTIAALDSPEITE